MEPSRNKMSEESVPCSQGGEVNKIAGLGNGSSGVQNTVYVPLSVPLTQENAPASFHSRENPAPCFVDQASFPPLASTLPAVNPVFNPLYLPNMYRPCSLPLSSNMVGTTNPYMGSNAQQFTGVPPSSSEFSGTASQLLSSSSYLMDMYRLAGALPMVSPAMNYPFLNPLCYMNFSGIGPYGVGMGPMYKDGLGTTRPLCPESTVGTGHQGCGPGFSTPAMPFSVSRPMSSCHTLVETGSRSDGLKENVVESDGGVGRGKQEKSEDSECSVNQQPREEGSEHQALECLQVVAKPESEQGRDNKLQMCGGSSGVLRRSGAEALETGGDKMERGVKKGGLRGHAICTSTTQVLFEGERLEWLTPITLEYILRDVDALLPWREADTDPNRALSVVQKVEKAKTLFTRFSTSILARPVDSSQHCGVCYEGVRPRDLAFLGDMLVFCKDCSLAVHRRCYGVHWTLVDSTCHDKVYFLCQVCQYRRCCEKKEKDFQVTALQCIICCQRYEAIADAQAFHPIAGQSDMWVHTYCALLCKEYISINDVRSMSGIAVTGDWNTRLSTRDKEAQEMNLLNNPHGRSIKQEDNATEGGGSQPCCMFCAQKGGWLLKCSHEACDAWMHMLCLKRHIFQQEQEERNLLAGALSVSWKGSSSCSGPRCEAVKVFCLSHTSAPRYCACQQPFLASEQSVMVGCDVCGDWLHGSCIGSVQVNHAMQSEYYQCVRCQSQRFYLMFLNQLWACYPLDHQDVVTSRELLVKLQSLMACLDLPFPASQLKFLDTVLPPHVCPLPFVDMVLLAFAWQWRAEILLLADRVVLMPSGIGSLESCGVLKESSLSQTLPQEEESQRNVKRLHMKKKEAGARTGARRAGETEARVALRSVAYRGVASELEWPLLKSSSKSPCASQKMRGRTQQRGLNFDTPKAIGTLRTLKKKKTFSEGQSREGWAEERCAGQEKMADPPCDQEPCLGEDQGSGFSDAFPPGSGKEVSQSGKVQRLLDLRVETGTLLERLWPSSPVCTMKQLHELLRLAEDSPVGLGECVGELGSCLGRCEAWIRQAECCLATEDDEGLEKCLRCFEEASVVEFLAEWKTRGKPKNVSAAAWTPQKLYKTFLAVGTTRKGTGDSSIYVMGALCYLTQEAMQLRHKGVAQLFIKEASPVVFGTPRSSLSIFKMREMVANIEKTPELFELKHHAIYKTAKEYMRRVEECQQKARELSSQPLVSLEEIRALMRRIQDELPGEHHLELCNLPQLLEKGTALENKVERRNLRSIRETLAQAQHLPIRSVYLSELQELVTKIDVWRKEYQRFVSLVKAAPLARAPSSSGELLDSESRNVIVSGRSGFLKNLFLGSDHSNTSAPERLGTARVEPDTSNLVYTQSQTLEDALDLLRRKSELDVECDQVSQLEDWIHQCLAWVCIVERLLACCLPLEKATPFPHPTSASPSTLLDRQTFELCASRPPQTNYWDLFTMENLLRRKVELPLAVSPSLVSSLENRVKELQETERRILGVAQGVPDEPRGSNASWFLDQSAVEALYQEAECLVQSAAHESSSTRVAQLHKACETLCQHLQVYNQWEHMIQRMLTATNALVSTGDLGPGDPSSVLEILKQEAVDPHALLAYPPSTPSCHQRIECLVRSLDDKKLRSAWGEVLDAKGAWEDLGLKSPLVEGQEECGETSLDFSMGVPFQDSRAVQCLQTREREEDISGVTKIRDGWEAVERSLKTPEKDDSPHQWRFHVVKWATLLAVHFLVLGDPNQLRRHVLYRYFVKLAPSFFTALKMDPDTVWCIFLPSSHASIQSVASLENMLENKVNPDPGASFLFSMNLFLISTPGPLIHQCLERLCSLWLMSCSDLFMPCGVLPSPKVVEDLVKIHESLDCGARGPCSAAPLWRTHDPPQDTNGVNLDQNLSQWHFSMLEILVTLQECTRLKRAAHVQNAASPDVSLEVKLLSGLKRLTWKCRANKVVGVLENAEALMCFAPDACLYAVGELLREYDQAPNEALKDTEASLRSFMVKFQQWKNRFREFFSNPAPCHQGAPQLFLPHPSALEAWVSLDVVLGVPEENTVKLVALSLDAAQASSDAASRAWREAFIRVEWSFRERWFHEAVPSSSPYHVNASNFTKCFELLQQDILCLGTLEALLRRSEEAAVDEAPMVKVDATASFKDAEALSVSQLASLIQRQEPSLALAQSTHQTLSSLEAPLFFGAMRPPRVDSDPPHHPLVHAPWCSGGDSHGDPFQCCWTSHIFFLRDIYTALFQGYATGVARHVPLEHAHRQLCCLDGTDRFSAQPASQHTFTWWACGDDQTFLHHQSLSAYRLIQNAVAYQYFQRLTKVFRHLQRFLVERPVLCALQHPLWQLLTLQKELVEWSVSALYAIVRCMGLDTGYLDEDPALRPDVRLAPLCCLERFLTLLHRLDQLRERLTCVAQEALSSELLSTPVVKDILCAFGVQWTEQNEPDFTRCGGFLYLDLAQRLHLLHQKVDSLSSCLVPRPGTSLEFLTTLAVCQACVEPCLGWNVHQGRRVRPIVCGALPLHTPYGAEPHGTRGETLEKYNTFVEDVLRNIYQDVSSCEKLEKCIVSFFLLLIFWCVRHATNFQEESPQQITLRRFLLTLPPPLVELLQSTQDVFESMHLLPFLHLTSELGLLVLQWEHKGYTETTFSGHQEAVHLVYVLSEVFLWLPFALDLMYLRTAPLSLLVPQHSEGYRYFSNWISSTHTTPFNDELPFLAQALDAFRQCLAQPLTCGHVSEALLLPLDILKWRSKALGYSLPHTITYDTLKTLLNTKQALDSRLENLQVYFSCLSPKQTTFALPFSTRYKILHKLFPSPKVSQLPTDLFIDVVDALAWICTNGAVSSRDTTQLTPSAWFKHALPECEELARRYDIATLTVNEFQLGLDALKKPFGSTRLPSSTFGGLANPYMVTPLLNNMRRQRVCHAVFETVLMYLEDLHAWENAVRQVLATLHHHQLDQKTRLDRLPCPEPSPTTAFNRWGLLDHRALAHSIHTLWEAYGLIPLAGEGMKQGSSCTHSDHSPQKTSSIFHPVSLDTLKALVARFHDLHCTGETGHVPTGAASSLHDIVQALTRMEEKGKELLARALSLVKDCSVNGDILLAQPSPGQHPEDPNRESLPSDTLLGLETLEDFLQQSFLTHIPCHGRIKDLFRRYMELEYLATCAFSSEHHTPIALQLPRPTACAPLDDAQALGAQDHPHPTDSCPLDQDIYEGCQVSVQDLVYAVAWRAQTVQCPVYGKTRHRILQQCWISAVRCVMKGFWGSGESCNASVACGQTLPFKVLQCLFFVGRGLFDLRKEEVPMELNYLKVLLTSAKRFLLEARGSLETWIRLRMMVDYFPIYFGEEMKVIQDKLQKKFPTLLIDLVVEKDQLEEIQLYKNKQLQTRYVPATKFDMKPCYVLSKSQDKLKKVVEILEEARLSGDPSRLEDCYSCCLHAQQRQELLEKPVRDAAQNCLHQLFAESSLSDSKDREQLLYDSAPSCVNSVYFQSLQDMMLKRLKKTVTVHRINDEASGLPVPPQWKLSHGLPTDQPPSRPPSGALNEKDSLDLLLMPRSKWMEKTWGTHNPSSTSPPPLTSSSSSALLSAAPPLGQVLQSATEQEKTHIQGHPTPPPDATRTPSAAGLQPTMDFPPDMDLTSCERAGFLWHGTLTMTHPFSPNQASPVGLTHQDDWTLPVWLVPLFLPIPKMFLVALRSYSQMELEATMSLQDFADYMNPLYPTLPHSAVQLLNVVVTADWNLDEHSDTQDAKTFVRDLLRPKHVTVNLDVPKSQIPIECLESLERQALLDSFKVLCFRAKPSPTSSSISDAPSAGWRLWIVPPEPLVTESLLSSTFPKSSQLVFGLLEVPSGVFEDARFPENASSNVIRHYAALVTQSLKNLQALPSKDSTLPRFTNLRVTFPPTAVHWVLRTAETSPQPNETLSLPPRPQKECQTDSAIPGAVSPGSPRPEAPFQDPLTNDEASRGGAPRIPKRSKPEFVEPRRAPPSRRGVPPTQSQCSDSSRDTQPDTVQPLSLKHKKHASVPAFSRLSKNFPVWHQATTAAPPRSITQTFSSSQLQKKGSPPPWQQRYQGIPRRPWAAPPFVIQSPRARAHRPPPITPHVPLPSSDPYENTVNAPLDPSPSFSSQSFSPSTGGAPWREQQIQDLQTSNTTTLPPWKQQRISHSEQTIPLKVPQALKSLIQNAAAELRIHRFKENPSH